MYYRSGERARITMRPQTKYARSQGTPSPQISVTFCHFNYKPIIWRRGPRLRADWYMRTDIANPRILTPSQCHTTQIPALYLHFNLHPIIWCRDPLPKAHWYMHTDANNLQECHNLTQRSSPKGSWYMHQM